VHERCPQVQVVRITAKAEGDVCVDGDADQCGDDDDPALDRFRIGEAAQRLVADGDDDPDQDDRVHKRGQNAHAVVAVAPSQVGRSVGLGDGEPGQAEGEDVREHVPRV